jgi:PAS domain S-box-containing protein
MADNKRFGILSNIGCIMSIALGLYLSSRYSYLFFHCLIEIATIAVGFTLFILTWNIRQYLANTFLRLLGIGYGFIALLDLLHTLSYKGMNVFPGFDANLPTQLWIAARYLQTVTLVGALLFLERQVDDHVVFAGYAAAIAVLAAMIYSGNFPDCFIEGVGLTAFKINSEYLISALLLAMLYLFFRQRRHFSNRTFWLITSSIACTVISELSFTAYVSVYGFANLIGHFAKLAAFYLIYRAILVTGLKDPFELIFRDLKQAEESLRQSQDTLEATVTERTAELRVSEKKFRSLIDKVQTAVVLHDGQGLFLSGNPLALELLGLSAGQLLGKALIDPDWHFLRGDGSVMPVAEYPVSRVLATQAPLRDYLAGISRPDRDEVIWVLVNADPQYGETGGIVQVIVSFVDITERMRTEEEIRILNQELEQRVLQRTAELEKKRVELQDSQIALMNIVEDLNEKTLQLEHVNAKLKELDQLKSMFIASMSHELRTPLNSIIGFSSIILNEWTGPLNPEQKENIAAVLRSGKHLLSLINDVIDVSKIETGKIESIVEDFDVREVVMEAVETFKKDIEKKGLELTVRACRHVLHVDRRRLLQCLLNLLSNAIKFTLKGSINIYAELSEDGSMFTIAVEDTGIGIEEQDLGKLFSPFVRLRTSMESVIPGTGLGLYLTRKLLQEILKGDIHVTSTHGAGSRFTIRLPVGV